MKWGWPSLFLEHTVNVTAGDCEVDKLQVSWTGVIAVRKEHVNSNLEAKMQMLMPEPQIFVERTLALIKPDVVDKEEEIEDLILRSGFLIVQVTGCAPEKITALDKSEQYLSQLSAVKPVTKSSCVQKSIYIFHMSSTTTARVCRDTFCWCMGCNETDWLFLLTTGKHRLC